MEKPQRYYCGTICYTTLRVNGIKEYRISQSCYILRRFSVVLNPHDSSWNSKSRLAEIVFPRIISRPLEQLYV